MRSIISGAILIGLGFAWDDSIFQGHFGVTSIFFDGLGIFFIVKGAYKIWRDRQPQE